MKKNNATNSKAAPKAKPTGKATSAGKAAPKATATPKAAPANPTLREATDEQLYAEFGRRIKANCAARIAEAEAEIVKYNAARVRAVKAGDKDLADLAILYMAKAKAAIKRDKAEIAKIERDERKAGKANGGAK